MFWFFEIPRDTVTRNDICFFACFNMSLREGITPHPPQARSPFSSRRRLHQGNLVFYGGSEPPPYCDKTLKFAVVGFAFTRTACLTLMREVSKQSFDGGREKLTTPQSFFQNDNSPDKWSHRLGGVVFRVRCYIAPEYLISSVRQASVSSKLLP